MRPSRLVCLAYANPSIRALLRLALLRITRRPLLSPPIPEREFDPENLPADSDASTSPTLAATSPPSSLPSTPEHLKNNHVALPPHPLLTPPPPTHSPIPVEEYLLPKALTTASVKAPTSLVKPLSNPKEWLSEVIYILRPLIYGKSQPRSQKVSCSRFCSHYASLWTKGQQAPRDGSRYGTHCSQPPSRPDAVVSARAIRIRSQGS